MSVATQQDLIVTSYGRKSHKVLAVHIGVTETPLDETLFMNAELVNQAMEKVCNPYVLVNLISRRVRQLNGAGGAGRPLITNTGNLSTGDIALREIIEEKIGFEMPPISKLIRPAGQNRARPHGWVKVPTAPAMNVAA